MGLVLLACSMLPVYLAGQLILNKQNQSSLEQKETKLDNSTTGIRQTVQEQIKLTASLTQWYSQDRSLIKAGGNIFFSSVVWDKMDSFNALAESVSATYILDQNWKPIYDSKGSLYHFEQ
ncbi:GGDEF domain-containing protein, partial [Vibrio coralliirubri]